MNASIIQINKKPKINQEVGLPKIPVDKAEVTFSGIVGDYNRFRSTKKNTVDASIMAVAIQKLTAT